MQRCEVTLEMDPDDIVPFRLRHVHEHAVAQNPGVVDEHVDVTEGVDGALDQALGTREVGDVVGVGDRLAAHSLDLLHDRLGRPGVGSRTVLGAAEVIDHDPGPFVSKEEGVSATDASTCARDHCDPTVQCAHVCLLCRPGPRSSGRMGVRST